MPRGDGTGPGGGGGRGRGRGAGMGRGRGRGQGQGQGMRRGGRGGMRGQPGGLSTFPGALPLGSPPRIGPSRKLAVTAEHQLGVGDGRGAVLRAGHTAPVAHVDERACRLCGACQTVCPTEAISLGDTAVRINAEACCGCGACAEACPNGAIKLD